MFDRIAQKYPWFPYVLPILIFLSITQAEGSFKEQYPYIYIGKVVLTTIALVLCRRNWSDIKVERKWNKEAIMMGVLMLLTWIVIDKTVNSGHVGTRTAYDPFKEIENPALRMAFLSVRFIGLAALVPVMEELFWRSFALRFATQPDYQKLPIGEFSATGVAIVSAVFAFSHPEWLPALIFSLAMALLLYKTKSVYACVLSHAVTNFGLGVYILATKQWQYW